MAQDILTDSEWSGSNMKPEPDEIADSLWAQKIAENTGFLYYRRRQAIQFALQCVNGPSSVVTNPTIGTVFFEKFPGHGTMTGTIITESTAPGAQIFCSVDGTLVHTNPGGTTMNFTYSMDISHLPDDSLIQASVQMTANVPGNNVVLLRGWSAWTNA